MRYQVISKVFGFILSKPIWYHKSFYPFRVQIKTNQYLIECFIGYVYSFCSYNNFNKVHLCTYMEPKIFLKHTLY